jgi:hypothetical protein
MPVAIPRATNSLEDGCEDFIFDLGFSASLRSERARSALGFFF